MRVNVYATKVKHNYRVNRDAVNHFRRWTRLYPDKDSIATLYCRVKYSIKYNSIDKFGAIDSIIYEVDDSGFKNVAQLDLPKETVKDLDKIDIEGIGVRTILSKEFSINENGEYVDLYIDERVVVNNPNKSYNREVSKLTSLYNLAIYELEQKYKGCKCDIKIENKNLFQKLIDKFKNK